MRGKIIYASLAIVIMAISAYWLLPLALLKIGNSFTRGYSDYDKAIIFYDAILRIRPDYMKARYNKMVCLTRKGEFESALGIADQIIKMYGPSDKLYMAISYIYFREEKSPEALAYINKAIEMNQKDGELLMQRAFVYYQMGDKEKAESDAESAIRLSKSLQLEYDYELLQKWLKGDQGIEPYNDLYDYLGLRP